MSGHRHGYEYECGYECLRENVCVFVDVFIVYMFHSENSLSVKYKVGGASPVTAYSMKE